MPEGGSSSEKILVEGSGRTYAKYSAAEVRACPNNFISRREKKGAKEEGQDKPKLLGG